MLLQGKGLLQIQEVALGHMQSFAISQEKELPIPHQMKHVLDLKIQRKMFIKKSLFRKYF